MDSGGVSGSLLEDGPGGAGAFRVSSLQIRSRWACHPVRDGQVIPFALSLSKGFDRLSPNGVGLSPNGVGLSPNGVGLSPNGIGRDAGAEDHDLPPNHRLPPLRLARRRFTSRPPPL